MNFQTASSQSTYKSQTLEWISALFIKLITEKKKMLSVSGPAKIHVPQLPDLNFVT